MSPPLIKDLVFSGKLKEIFTPLLPIFPQAFRYVIPELLDEIWPDILKILGRMDIKTEGRDRESILVELMKQDPIQLASEIDRDPFKTLIRTILSARTKDEQTIKISNILFEEFDTAEKLANASEDRVKEIIKPIGFYNAKTKYIMGAATALLGRHGGKVPDSFKDLVALPGVGAKVANCVLVYAFGIPAIPVDTHVHRIVNRWGLVETKDPEKTNKELEDILPRDWWLLVNDLLIRFGKEICKPITPNCPECPLDACCPKIIIKKSQKTQKNGMARKKKRSKKNE